MTRDIDDHDDGEQAQIEEPSTPEELVKVLAKVEGPCAVHQGVLWLEDGTSIDLNKLLEPKGE